MTTSIGSRQRVLANTLYHQIDLDAAHRTRDGEGLTCVVSNMWHDDVQVEFRQLWTWRVHIAQLPIENTVTQRAAFIADENLTKPSRERDMADNSHIMAIPLERPVPQQLLEQSPIGNELGNEGQADSHKRTYQACIACRQRKVKCDRGPVDTPIDGPCKRCKREKKECLFSATRKKRKRDNDPNGSADEGLDEDFIRRNSRSINAHGTIDPFTDSPYHTYVAAPPAPPLQRPPRPELPPIRRPTSASHNLTNPTASKLLMSPINTSGEALHLLVDAADAAKRNEEMERQTGHEAAGRASAIDSKSDVDVGNVNGSPIDPAITVDVRDPQTEAEQAEIQVALQAWSRLRFVHAGWLTNKEAMGYVDYYYRFLAPLTPISIPDFSAPASQPKFLSEEPMLVVTVLTIASRFKKLEGPAGESRSFLVHENLWKFLQNMITRMFWGQEQFGGGFCGAGSSVVAGLRGLGTVESLLLISDWHPRSMHFPPGDDGNEILLPLPKDEIDIRATVPQRNSVGWAEPAMRSDRMSWSLIGCAYTLAFELGVFDCLATQEVWEPRTDPAFERSNRVGRLLYIYVGLITGKLGYPNMLPQQVRAAQESPYLKMVTLDEISRGQAPDDIQGNIQRAWAEITSLMRATNEEMFSTPARIAEIIRSRSYFELLTKYKPRLEAWLTRFHQLQIPPQARIVLLMEYEYMRAFCNSHALQAVLDECAADASTNNARSTTPLPGNTPPALLSSRLVDIMRVNAPFINELTDASRKLLQHAVDGLSGPTKLLKHVSSRTYFRILSCAMFLLKTFALGGRSDDVEISLQLLKNTIHALRKAVVDDVHLCNRIADLLEYVSRIIGNKFVVIKVAGSLDNTQAAGHSPAHLRGGNSNTGLGSPNQHKIHQRTSSGQSRSSFAGPSRATSNRLHPSFAVLNEELYSGPLAGIAVNTIDPNDARFSIMPPPDYVFHGANNQQNGTHREDNDMNNYTYPAPTQDSVTNNNLYTQLQAAVSEQRYNSRPNRSPETSFSSPPSHTSNPNANSNAIVNGNANGTSYNWMALNLQNYGNPQPQHALQTQSNTIYGGALNSAGSYGGDGNDGWGAFGPELSGSLETLGLLGEGFSGMGMGVGLGMGSGMSGLDNGVWDGGNGLA